MESGDSFPRDDGLNVVLGTQRSDKIDAQLKMVYKSRFFSSHSLGYIQNNYGSFADKTDRAISRLSLKGSNS